MRLRELNVDNIQLFHHRGMPIVARDRWYSAVLYSSTYTAYEFCYTRCTAYAIMLFCKPGVWEFPFSHLLGGPTFFFKFMFFGALHYLV